MSVEEKGNKLVKFSKELNSDYPVEFICGRFITFNN